MAGDFYVCLTAVGGFFEGVVFWGEDGEHAAVDIHDCGSTGVAGYFRGGVEIDVGKDLA